MQDQCLFYGSSVRNSKDISKKIFKITSNAPLSIKNMRRCKAEDYREFNHMLMGIYVKDNRGDYLVFAQFKLAEPYSKSKISFLGINNSEVHSIEFLNAVALLYDYLVNQNILAIGPWPANEYDDLSASLKRYEFFGIASKQWPNALHINNWKEKIAATISLKTEEAA
ncbi:MAG: hypothetical protein U9P71_01930 [Campylobacterota bacterium]|nr:hypothetical protein [Campylobacterota bacterium]